MYGLEDYTRIKHVMHNLGGLMTVVLEDLHKRRVAAVARGVSSTITSYVDHAGGGTLTDVDGREWIDFAPGIAVTSVGNAAPRVVEAVQAQVERFTHTCFMVDAVRGRTSTSASSSTR